LSSASNGQEYDSGLRRRRALSTFRICGVSFSKQKRFSVMKTEPFEKLVIFCYIVKDDTSYKIRKLRSCNFCRTAATFLSHTDFKFQRAVTSSNLCSYLYELLAVLLVELWRPNDRSSRCQPERLLCIPSDISPPRGNHLVLFTGFACSALLDGKHCEKQHGDQKELYRAN